MMTRLSRFFAPLLEKRCAACSSPVAASADGNGEETRLCLCSACSEKLILRRGGYCPVCGNLTTLPDAEPSLCGACLTRRNVGEPQPWGALFFFAPYEGFLRDLILRCKATQELPLARLLGELLASHPGISAGIPHYDAIVPVPLHAAKLRKRGFNQALEMAKPLARRMNAPLLRDALRRTAETHSQSGLSLEDRKRNVHAAFAATGDIAGKRVLLVDDIATTCATLEEAAIALKKSGVEHIDAAVIARTPELFPR